MFLQYRRPAKTTPFIILLCLTPDYFTHQGRGYGWERVNNYTYNLKCKSKYKKVGVLSPFREQNETRVVNRTCE